MFLYNVKNSLNCLKNYLLKCILLLLQYEGRRKGENFNRLRNITVIKIESFDAFITKEINRKALFAF